MRRVASACRLILAAFALCAFTDVLAVAHTGPHEVIEQLTAEMTTEGTTPYRLVRRAVEFRILGHQSAAVRDLEAALDLDPANVAALRELARVHVRGERFDAALDCMDRALANAPQEPDRLGLYAMRAEINESQGRLVEALDDVGRALETSHPELDWLLLRSNIQRSLGRHTERVADLREAVKQNPSVVLEFELTDALIDAAQYDESLARIDERLSRCRACSDWRIRRARVFLGQGDIGNAEAELHIAIAEIDRRLDTRTAGPVDITLVVERATAFALLGDHARAEAGLTEARAHSAQPWLIAPLEALVHSAASSP